MKNPKWHRDEIILALDLYFSPDRGTVDAHNPKIVALSELLNKLPIHSSKPDAKTFRNPNGVSLKLSNFLAIDPSHKGKGMLAYSVLDKQVFFEFYQDQPRLHQIAEQIKLVATNATLSAEVNTIEEDDEDEAVLEGQVLYKLHKARERNKKIVGKKKEQAMKKYGKLACERCGFDFHATYGDIGKGFIECHHIQPLASLPLSATTLDDLILVCANCHRMLHRGMILNNRLK